MRYKKNDAVLLRYGGDHNVFRVRSVTPDGTSFFKPWSKLVKITKDRDPHLVGNFTWFGKWWLRDKS